MKYLRTFVRGIVLMIIPLIIGTLIEPHISSRVIGVACAIVLLFVVYMSGAILSWPWERHQ